MPGKLGDIYSSGNRIFVIDGLIKQRVMEYEMRFEEWSWFKANKKEHLTIMQASPGDNEKMPTNYTDYSDFFLF